MAVRDNGKNGSVVTNATLPTFNANMSVPAVSPNFWTMGQDGNPSFNIPNFWPSFTGPASPPTTPVTNPLINPTNRQVHQWQHLTGNHGMSMADVVGTPAFITWFQSLGTQR